MTVAIEDNLHKFATEIKHLLQESEISQKINKFIVGDLQLALLAAVCEVESLLCHTVAYQASLLSSNHDAKKNEIDKLVQDVVEIVSQDRSRFCYVDLDVAATPVSVDGESQMSLLPAGCWECIQGFGNTLVTLNSVLRNECLSGTGVRHQVNKLKHFVTHVSHCPRIMLDCSSSILTPHPSCLLYVRRVCNTTCSYALLCCSGLTAWGVSIGLKWTCLTTLSLRIS